MSSDTKWLPLESNPDVMNKFLYNMGMPKSWAIVDVFGLDEDTLQAVLRPVAAVLLFFPTGVKHEEFCKQQEEEMKSLGQIVSDEVYFMQQTIKNACGTVALIHAVANNTNKIHLEEGSAFKTFLDKTKDMSPEDRGKELETDGSIGAAHEESAQEGQTEAPSADEDVNLHFVAFVEVDGSALYELDGRKSFPINHGSSEADTLLEDAAKVCQKFMDRDPENLNFTVVALAAASPSE